MKRLDPRLSNSARGQDRAIESVSLSSISLYQLFCYCYCMLLLLNLNLMMLKRSQKALCPASLCCFSFSPSPFPHVPAQSCREPCGSSDLPWQPWAGKTIAVARHWEGSGKAPTIFHNAQVGFWIAKGRLQHVTVTLFKFKSTMFSS